MDNAPRKSTADTFREWVQFGLILLASIWGVYTFVYKEIVVPANRPASLEISATLVELGRTKDLALVRARIHAINKRDVRIYSPAIWFTAAGIELNSKNPAIKDKEAPEDDGINILTTSYSQQKRSVVAKWRFSDWHAWYDPDDETTNDVLFYTPVDQFTAIELKLEVVVAKSIDAVESVDWYDQPTGFSPIIKMKSGYNLNDLDTKYGGAHNWFIVDLSLLDTGKGAQSP